MAVAGAVRQSLRVGLTDPPYPTLTSDGAAYLAGGAQRAAYSALAGLLSRGVVQPHPVTQRLTAVLDEVVGASPLEQQLFAWIQRVRVVDPRRQRISNALDCRSLEGQLIAEGFIANYERMMIGVVIPLAISMIAPLVGVVKIFIGISRDRPVDFLILLCLGSLILNLWVLARKPKRTKMADVVLAEMRERHRPLRNARRAAIEPDSDELMLTVALFGVGALAYGPLAPLVPLFRPPPSFGDLNCGGISCGGGSSCGGGGGGGGCGGCSGH